MRITLLYADDVYVQLNLGVYLRRTMLIRHFSFIYSRGTPETLYAFCLR
jgi:hypothetical protein